MKTIKVLAIILLSISLNSFLNANEELTKTKVKSLVGKAYVKTESGEIKRISKDYKLALNDIIYTNPHSTLKIELEDKTLITIGSSSILKVATLIAQQNPGQSTSKFKSTLKLKVGKVRVKVPVVKGSHKNFAVETPVAVASVRGTEKEVSYSQDSGAKVRVLSGIVLLKSNNGLSKYLAKKQIGKAKNINTKTAYQENVDSKKQSLKSQNQTDSDSSNLITQKTNNTTTKSTEAKKVQAKINDYKQTLKTLNELRQVRLENLKELNEAKDALNKLWQTDSQKNKINSKTSPEEFNDFDRVSLRSVEKFKELYKPRKEKLKSASDKIKETLKKIKITSNKLKRKN